MTREEYKRMDELLRQGRYVEWCDYYEKPLKVLTEDELDHCRNCGDICNFRGRSCDCVSLVAEGFEGEDWDEDWNWLWDELNK